MLKLPRAAVWVCAAVLTVVFVAMGISKLLDPSATRWAERFELWGYPPGVQFVVGIVEIVAAIGLLLPTSRRAAGLALMAIMVGAFCTHALQVEFARLIPPMVLGGLAFLVSASRD